MKAVTEKRRERPANTNTILIDVPIPIKRRFKSVCAQKGLSMKEMLIQLMDEAGKLSNEKGNN